MSVTVSQRFWDCSTTEALRAKLEKKKYKGLNLSSQNKLCFPEISRWMNLLSLENKWLLLGVYIPDSSHDGNTFRSHQQVKHSDVHMKLFSLTLSRYLRKTFVIPCITSDLETEKKGLYSSSRNKMEDVMFDPRVFRRGNSWRVFLPLTASVRHHFHLNNSREETVWAPRLVSYTHYLFLGVT